MADRIPRFLMPLAVLIFCLIALVPASVSAECTIHGNVYDWSTFNEVNNAIVEVYSLPGISLTEQAVTKSGSYSFSLPQGSYMIKASSGTPGMPDEITAIENITVPATGEHVIDLILFPPGTLDDLTGYVDDNTNATATLSPTESPTASPVPTPQSGSGDWILYMGAGAILLAIIAIAAGLLFLRRMKPKPPAEPPAVYEESRLESPPAISPAAPLEEPKQETPEQPPQLQEQQLQQPPLPQPSTQELLLPQDCREVLAIMEKNGGRITQLDLRKALPYSEAKVSLIVSDLESRGLVKKIKKGRGNVLIMNRPGQPDEKKGSNE